MYLSALQVPIPVLTGSVIEATAIRDLDKNGILLFLSPDTQASLKSAIDSSYAKVMDTTLSVAALLLAQLPNLRQLDLGPIFVQRSTFIGMVLSSAVCEPGGCVGPIPSRLGSGTRSRKFQNTPGLLPFF
ncbi:hypothetical protein N7448_001323 [Penicillium atrosanguineum]|nr:hypothetical protein N7526_005019 [Penicillium atrosanguineum]KAJ5149745.1 hypothetical protein N7448_001323 [Penicillium atrosanguineum]